MNYNKIFLLIAFTLCTFIVSAQNTEKWKTYFLGDWCSLRIPNTMELRDASSTSGAFINKQVQRGIGATSEAFSSSKRMVFQPKGMNSSASQDVYPATSEFARVIVRILPPDGMTQSDVDSYSEVDLKELNSLFYEHYYSKMKNYGNIEQFKWFPLRRIKYSGRNALVFHYKRHGLEGSVDITEYRFFLRGEQLCIVVTYRDSEQSKWASDLSKVISTLKIL